MRAHKRLEVFNHKNLCIRLDHYKMNYYWREIINSRLYEKTTHVKADFEVIEIEGKKYARPKNNSNFKLALSVADQLRNNVIKHGIIPKNISFEKLFDEVLEIQEQKSKRTFIISKDCDKHLRKFLSKKCKTIRDFEINYEKVWGEYVKLEKGKSGRKLFHDSKYLVFCLRYAYRKNWISRIYSRTDFPIPDKIMRVGKYIEDHDIKKILNEVETIGDKKFYCQLMIALHMGFRKSEILSLALNEIDQNRREINVDYKRVKTRQPRVASNPIPQRVWDLLEPFIRRCEEINGIYIFPKEVSHRGFSKDRDERDPIYNFSKPQTEFPKYWDDLRKRLGLKIRFHDLRHTCITNLLLKNIPIAVVSNFVGADIKILSDVYSHHNEEVKEKIRTVFDGRF